uniref:Uncharacterized protein n=1 Tax=Acrobeloides nanus TaxID=290746 RepID=A0A914EC66_9BILA
MKEFRGGIIRLFEQGKSGYQIAIIGKQETTMTDQEKNQGPDPAESEQSKEFYTKALKKSLVKAWNAIPQEVIDRAVDDFPKRLKKCIDAQGGHFENK